MDKHYSFSTTEERIYKLWEENRAFSPDRDSSDSPDDSLKTKKAKKTKNGKKPFSIIMPPPNANDPLHVGHALFVSIEDILIRFHRMLGDDTVWIPGTDHAGIETQFVFEKKLQKQGKSRFNFDREALFKMIWDYVQENSGVAVEQIKRIGASADWERFKFTLNPEIVEKVLETFKQLHQDGLVYRDLRLVNYCTKCGTSYSDLEVVHVEKTTPLYYMKYGPFVLATTRPETKFGDTAVAVHPKDKRYQKYVGQTIKVEGVNGPFKIKVIADEYVDPEFGTGVVKITPAHDFNDFEVWQRHKDEIGGPVQVIDFNGKLNEHAGKFAGLNVMQAREQIVEALEEMGLIEKIDEKYITSIGTCYRCGRTIEPLPMPQFYIKVKDKKKNLVEGALKALDEKQTIVHGAGQKKILKHWLNNLKDWNISRQIVWGIRIPVWYEIDGYEGEIQVGFLDKNKKFKQGKLSDLLSEYSLKEILKGLQEMSAAAGVPYSISESQPKTGNWIPETNTFDTWFSSSQWPVVTLKTNKPGDFERFYPTTVMETGYDILPFWVMRMMLLCNYMTEQAPFKEVYLHGLVRDQKGQKMSKSKGNVINPLEVIQTYGADSLRMALVIRSTAGQDKNVGESDFRAMRNLSNKIWNASRFVIMRTIESPDVSGSKSPNNNTKDEEFFEKLDKICQEITKQLLDRKIGLAAETTYNEFWHWFCDIVIEDNKAGEISDRAVTEGLSTFLKLLHPFVPFVTEEIWQIMRQHNLVDEPLLITSAWPSKRLA